MGGQTDRQTDRHLGRQTVYAYIVAGFLAALDLPIQQTSLLALPAFWERHVFHGYANKRKQAYLEDCCKRKAYEVPTATAGQSSSTLGEKHTWDHCCVGYLQTDETPWLCLS